MEHFFKEILKHRIPVNLRALAAIQAPLAMDLYVWLTYRLHALTKPVTMPWKALHLQCGSQTPRVPVFRCQVIQKLPSILTVYPEAQVQEAKDRSGLTLWPNGEHVTRRRTFAAAPSIRPTSVNHSVATNWEGPSMTLSSTIWY